MSSPIITSDDAVAARLTKTNENGRIQHRGGTKYGHSKVGFSHHSFASAADKWLIVVSI